VNAAWILAPPVLVLKRSSTRSYEVISAAKLVSKLNIFLLNQAPDLVFQKWSLLEVLYYRYFGLRDRLLRAAWSGPLGILSDGVEACLGFPLVRLQVSA
jgi:hypothetical protein